MRLTRRGEEKDHGEYEVANQELAEDAGYTDSTRPYPTGYSCGFNGNEFFLGISAHWYQGSTHWYQLSLTPEEMRILLSRSLEDTLPDSEKELWETLFDLWEKTAYKTHRKRSRH